MLKNISRLIIENLKKIMIDKEKIKEYIRQASKPFIGQKTVDKHVVEQCLEQVIRNKIPDFKVSKDVVEVVESNVRLTLPIETVLKLFQ